MLQTLPFWLALVLLIPRPALGQGASAAGGMSLLPGDAVKLQIWQEPDLSGTFRVDEDTTLTLPLLGQRPVAGISVPQLRSGLVKDYGFHLKNPSIEVTVLRRISVLGEVRNPGLYDVDPTTDVSEVIAMAGGLTEDGDYRGVEIVGPGGGQPRELDVTAPVGASVKSGDQIVVNQRGWFSRNGTRLALGFGGVVAAVLVRAAVN